MPAKGATSVYRGQAFKDKQWQRSAEIVADGVERAGLVAIAANTQRAVETGSAEITDAVWRSAVVTIGAIEAQTESIEGLARSVDLQSEVLERQNDLIKEVASVLVTQTEVLAQMERMMRSPRATEAQELYVRGANALKSGWIPEAIKDLSEAIEKNPYDASAHFARALALGAGGKTAESAQAFSQTVRYSSNESHLDSLAAGAAILGARTFMELGQKDEARDLVQSVLNRVGPCAELELLNAHFTGDVESVRRAITIAPELALDAVVMGLPSVEELAQEVVQSGTVNAMYSISHSARKLNIPTVNLPPLGRTPDAMSAHPGWLRGVARLQESIVPIADELAAVKSELQEHQEVVEAAPASVGPRPSRIALAIFGVVAVSGFFFVWQTVAGIEVDNSSVWAIFLRHGTIGTWWAGYIGVLYLAFALMRLVNDDSWKKKAAAAAAAKQSSLVIPQLMAAVNSATERLQIAEEILARLPVAVPERVRPIETR